MPTFNTINGQGTPPPVDASYGEEVIVVTQQAEPEAPDPNAAWLGDGYDAGPPTGDTGGGMAAGGTGQPSQPVDPSAASEPKPEPPPYEPHPDTDPVSKFFIRALDYLDRKQGDVDNFAQALDKRIPWLGYGDTPGAGRALGQDLSDFVFETIPAIIGPKPGHEPRPKPWVW